METELVFGYVLYANDHEVAFGRTLQETQAAASQYLDKKANLRIKSAVAPAPTQIWNYDYTIQKWVELVRAS